MKISCFTCKYGYEDKRLGNPMCHHPLRFSKGCVNFNLYEEKETEELEKTVPADPYQAAEISFDEAYALTEDYRDFLAKGLTENQPRPIGPHWFCEYAKNRFIAGAKWTKEQMMENAVEGEITKDNRGNNVLRAGLFNNGFEIGDKVRVIVLKKED